MYIKYDNKTDLSHCPTEVDSVTPQRLQCLLVDLQSTSDHTMSMYQCSANTDVNGEKCQVELLGAVL